MNHTLKEFLRHEKKIGVVGLGYVGLPLAIHFAKKFQVIGFDINPTRIEELKQGQDRTLEVEFEEIKSVFNSIKFTNDPAELHSASVVIVTVPTPIDHHKIPDLGPVIAASKTVGRHLRKGALVIYESTVYPGVTEDICVYHLEKESGFKWLDDFHVGYSPERINPGDKKHTFDKIIKVVAGDQQEVTEFMAQLYGEVVTAGVHKAPNIKTAEASKVIENTQRDINIALMNELSLIFEKVGIDTWEVLEAARTKWNFLPFEPGLVGGHCIGVDPYYLTFKSEELGYHPYVILAGRRVNDAMGIHIAEIAVKLLIKADKSVKNARVGVFGLTFKENIPDIRNTRVVDIIKELKDYGIQPIIHDPMCDPDEVFKEYGLKVEKNIEGKFDAVIVAVKHNNYKELGLNGFAELLTEPKILLDIKALFNRKQAEDLGILYWRL